VTVEAESIRFGEQNISGIWQSPQKPRACYIMAHGAGAGMRHALLESISVGLSAAGIACLRYQFPYMERASKRPDPPPVCHAAVRSAVLEAARLTSAPLIAGGRSFGGRMSSQAQALAPLPKVHGLAFIGFPLHTAHHPSDNRANHLFEIKVPMLFLQGTQDELADLTLLASLVKRLGEHATLTSFEYANHAFHVPKRSGRTDTQILDELIRALGRWILTVTATA
jgi:uncharacterized protein